MKTPKKIGTSPSQKMNKSSGGLVKKNVSATKQKLSLKATKHAKDALNDSETFNLVKSPLKRKKSVGETPKSNGVGPAKGKKSIGATPGPKSNGVSPAKAKKSIGGTPGPKSNGVTPKKAPKTPINNESPEVKLGLNIEKLLESPKSPKQDGKKGGKAKPDRKARVKLAKDPRDNPNIPFLKKAAVTNAVKALISTSKKESKTKKDILDNRSVLLFNVNFFKVPKASKGIIRAVLPFPFHENPDIAFIVSDLNKDKDGDPDDTIDHYKQLLSKLGITAISEIIPYKKLRTDYTQFEQKRKLINRFDLILVDAKVAHRVPALLKKSLIKKKNMIPIKLDKAEKVKEIISHALKKITMRLHRRGLSLTTQFGHSEMELNHLVDNIFSLSRTFQDVRIFSQGVANLRSIQIKTPKGTPLPVYISNRNPNDVKQEVIKKGPKSEPVTGELTTAENTMVTVFPDGKVVTKKMKSKTELKNDKKKEEEAKKDEDESDVDEDDLVLETSAGDIQVEDDDDEDDDDEDDDDEDDDLSEMELGIDSDDDEDSDDEEEDVDDDEENEEPKLNLKGKKALPKMDADSEDESSGDDEEIEAAEQEFLQELRQQQDAISKKRKVDNKQKPKKGAVTEEKKEKVNAPQPAKKPKVGKEGPQQGKKFNKGANNASPKFNKNNAKKFGGKPEGQSPKNKFGGKPNNKHSPKSKFGGKPNKFQNKGGKGKSP